jgi:antitoxin (DNA-binding transcriptional repressor) of toxin-antitoxin stability system
METVGSVEAKRCWAASLNRVAKGETIRITRDGVPVAMLAPVAGDGGKLSHREIVKGLRALRERVGPDDISVRQMVAEGRRQ